MRLGGRIFPPPLVFKPYEGRRFSWSVIPRNPDARNVTRANEKTELQESESRSGRESDEDQKFNLWCDGRQPVGVASGIDASTSGSTSRHRGSNRWPAGGSDCASAGVSVWILRLPAVRMRSRRLLGTGVFLQRHLHRCRAMVRLGIPEWLGRPSLPWLLRLEWT